MTDPRIGNNNALYPGVSTTSTPYSHKLMYAHIGDLGFPTLAINENTINKKSEMTLITRWNIPPRAIKLFYVQTLNAYVT